jgi:hypothetical protein
MMKRTLVVLMVGLIAIVPVSPSFAGSGSDGFVTVSWKDWKKSKAKRCAEQKVTVTLARPSDLVSFMITLYNNDDQVIADSLIIFDGNTKKSGTFLFCDSLGPGPYYVNVEYWTGLPGDGFDIPYKFKKK